VRIGGGPGPTQTARPSDLDPRPGRITAMFPFPSTSARTAHPGPPRHALQERAHARPEAHATAETEDPRHGSDPPQQSL
jgi:hypothetical protein